MGGWGTPGEELLMPNSPPEAINEYTPHSPKSKEPATLDRLLLKTSGPSAATREGTSKSDPLEKKNKKKKNKKKKKKKAPRTLCGQEAAATS